MKKCRKIRTRSIGKILPLCKFPQPFLLKRKLASKHLLSIGHLWLIKLSKTWKHSLLHSCRFEWALRPHLASPFPEPCTLCHGLDPTEPPEERRFFCQTQILRHFHPVLPDVRGLLPCLKGHPGSVCSLSIAQHWRSSKKQAQMWECHAPWHCHDPLDILLLCS